MQARSLSHDEFHHHTCCSNGRGSRFLSETKPFLVQEQYSLLFQIVTKFSAEFFDSNGHDTCSVASMFPRGLARSCTVHTRASPGKQVGDSTNWNADQEHLSLKLDFVGGICTELYT